MLQKIPAPPVEVGNLFHSSQDFSQTKNCVPSIDDTGLVQVKGIKLQTHFGQILGAVCEPTDGSPWGMGGPP